jgi:2-aminoadipate transaminase
MTRPAFATWMSGSNDITKIFLSAGRIPGLVNMAGGLPDPSVWPTEELAELSRRAVLDHSGDALGYSPIDGLPRLRDALAARYSTEGATFTRDNVLVTTAGMQGLDLVGKVLLDAGDIVAAQSPTYLGALDAWRPRTPRYRPMELESNAFDPRDAFAGAKFAYTVPNFSNPTGRLVSLPERERLVQAAHETGTWLVEDDPYGALHYDGPPLPRLIALSAAGAPGPYRGPVIYMGTTSKELAPGFRVGWVIAAPEVIAAMTAAKQGSDMCTSGLCQLVVAMAIESGLMDRIVPDILALYRTRRDTLLAAMEAHLADHLTWQRPEGGMFVWATARDAQLDTDALLPMALDQGVCVTPGSVFDPRHADHRSIRINFTFNPPDRLEEGVRRLAAAIRATLDRP